MMIKKKIEVVMMMKEMEVVGMVIRMDAMRRMKVGVVLMWWQCC